MLVVVIATFFTVLLIWTEIWLALAAAAWSLASMFDFGIAGYLLVAIVAGPLALWASWKTLVLAWAAERSDTY
ncbi:MAG: hypothetical protein BroJett030_09910 [Alphaproteobacteria bacterium]|nr:MAG: hypothetical protein BroJett030_09910 [Alphaproteobacteria bacterium]